MQMIAKVQPNFDISVEPVPIATAMAHSIDAIWTERIKDEFDSYLNAHRSNRWMIFSDYSLSSMNRANDVFAFTVLPGGEYFYPLLKVIQAGLKADFKKVALINENMTSALTDRRLFTVCFLLERDRDTLFTLHTIREMLDRTISMLESKDPTARRKILFAKLRLVRREARAKCFNVRQFENILLACGFASFLSKEICREMHPAAIGWFSDRDPIVDAFRAAANYFYMQNLADLMEPIANGWRGPDVIGTNESPPSGRTPWSDIYTRIPDYFAGVIAPLDVTRPQIQLPSAPKYPHLFEQVVRRNRNLKLIRVSPRHSGGSYRFETHLVTFEPAP
jgi:hypothetical protein